MEPNESKRLRHSVENPRLRGWEGEVEIVESPTMSFRNPSSTPMSSFDHGDHPSTTVAPLLSTPKSIRLDPEVVPHMGDSEPITSATTLQKTSAMDVDTIPVRPPKPVRRMLFKPVLPGRRNQSKTSTAQVSNLLTSDSAEPLSTSLSVDGHSKKDELEVTARAQDVVLLQEKPTSPRPRPPLLSRNCTPTSILPRHHRDAQEVEVPDTRVSLPKDEVYGNATDTDPDAELVVDILLRGTPEEPHNLNCSSNPLQQEIIEDLPPQKGHEDEDDRDGVVLAVKDTAAVEGLATQFLQRSVTPFFFVGRRHLTFCRIFRSLCPGIYSHSMWTV